MNIQRTDIGETAADRVAAWRGVGARIALVDDHGHLTYAALAEQVEAWASWLGTARRLILLEARNDIPSALAWLGARLGGHPTILVPSGSDRADLVAQLRPDLVIVHGDVSPSAPATTAGSLHPDLALVLPTSGSTGARKAVRLSSGNLDANADAIARTLGLRATDVAALTLPFAHAYGLSVLHSHLAVGAAVWLTQRSLCDADFADAFDRVGATTLPGVPYSFELAARSGFFDTVHPTLRMVTQAGGRLAPHRVRELARRGREQGWDLVVMYGQTEATARIATLAPQLAHDHAESVGRPIPGVRLRLVPHEASGDPGVGELVVEGPGVMLGYAHTRADLSLGRSVQALHTGDLATWTDAGQLRIVGRCARIAKPYGKRVDLGDLEDALVATGVAAWLSGHDHGLDVLVSGSADPEAVAGQLAARTGLPRSAVSARWVLELPRTAGGKVDGVAARRCLEHRPVDAPCADVADVFAAAFALPAVEPTDTFQTLAGDSLLYVAVSLQLGDLLGDLPRDWPMLSVAALQELADARTPADGWIPMEQGVVLRAVGIGLVVATHAGLLPSGAGAHLLLALAGYHFARFHLTDASWAHRSAGVVRSLLRWLVPCTLFLVALLALDPRYPSSILFLTQFVRPDEALAWRFWFLEALLTIQAAAVFAVVAADGVERRAPFTFPLILTVVAGLALGLLGGGLPNVLFTPLGTGWLFTLGWAVQRADTPARKRLVTLAVGVLCLGVLGVALRALVVFAGVLLLIARPLVPVPRVVAPFISSVAATSLVTYLTHFVVLDALPLTPWVGWSLCLAVGVGTGLAIGGAWRSLAVRARSLVRGLRRPAGLPAAP